MQNKIKEQFRNLPDEFVTSPLAGQSKVITPTLFLLFCVFVILQCIWLRLLALCMADMKGRLLV